MRRAGKLNENFVTAYLGAMKPHAARNMLRRCAPGCGMRATT